jgi:transketolase
MIHSPLPCYLRFNSRPAVFAHDPTFAFGKAEVVCEGTDVTLLTYGTLFTEAYQATELLKSEGLSVSLVNLRTLKPIDESLVLNLTQKTRLTVTLEDHFLTGGLFSILAELLLRNRTTREVLPLALDNWFQTGRFQEVLEHEGFSSSRIAQRILRKMENTVF